MYLVFLQEIKACNDSINNFIRSRGTPGCIHIYRNNILHAFHDMIKTMKCTRRCTARTHCYHIFGFRDLFPYPAKPGCLFQGYMPGYNQDIGMARGPLCQDTKAFNIEAGHQARNYLYITCIACTTIEQCNPWRFYPGPVYKALAYALRQGSHYIVSPRPGFIKSLIGTQLWHGAPDRISTIITLLNRIEPLYIIAFTVPTSTP